MSEKNSNRAAFPETAQVVDGLRAVFGAGIAVVWAEENGREVGERGPDGVPASPRCITELKKTGRAGA